MATTQTVIIDFQADFSSVQDAVDILEKTGKVDKELADTFRKTNAEINKQGQALDKTAQSANKDVQSFSKLNDLMKQFPKSGMNRFLLQVGNELAAAGVNAKDFYTKLDPKDAISKQTTLRNELKQVKEQMQQAALAGGVLGAEYLKLKERAGKLDDTIKDVSNDIKNAGSDTRGIDNVVGSITALAGGFSAVQGAAALFGDESEDLQKALLKVNAAMALATGLQQVANATTEQGSLTRIADTAATYGQIAAQKIYTFVTGKATAATTLFKVALAATGIGLVIVGLLALSQALKDTTSDLEAATDAIDAQNRALESSNALLQRNLSIDLARAELAGKAESDLIRIRGRSLQAQVKNIELSNRLLAIQRDSISATSEAWFKLNEQIDKNNDTIREINTDVLVTSINLEKQIADEKKKAGDDAIARQKELNDKALEAAKKQRALKFADYKAGIELKILAAEDGSRQELELQKDLLRAKLQIDLEAEGLSLNQRKLLIQTFFKERRDLESKYNKDLVAAGIEDEKNRLAASLENLNLQESDKLDIKIEFLRLSAAQEIAAAEGNATKILAINAKLNADISAAKVESIRKSANDEAALLSAQGGAGKRALEAVASNERLKADIRLNAIRQLADIEITALDKQIAANRRASEVIGSDQQALAIEYAQLLDQKAQKTEETEKKITDITVSENQKRRDSNLAYVQATLAGLQEAVDIIGGIQANQQEAAQQAIQRQRTEVDDLLKAGAITEKEAAQRNKRIEAQEKQAKNRAAQQQKNLAVFQALLSIPQAFIAGLTAPFPIGGPIYGGILAGLAAIQAGVIASRPVPKFATGKKGSYSGPGVVGDAGAELVQQGGRMWVAEKPTLTYLGSQDKVFTAGETKRMLPFVNKEAINATTSSETFDYEKLAKAVKQKQSGSTTVNIDKEFISESVADGLSRVNYFDRYYSSK